MNKESTINFGKKVFFVNPTFQTEKLVIPMLSVLEFEVYVIKDYTVTKSLLRKYPDSICLISMDNVLPLNTWTNFIIELSTDESLCNVVFGAMSARTTTIDKNHLLLNANLAAGFISLAENKENLVGNLQKILLLNEAKGRRKYIRAKSINNTNIHIQCEINNKNFALAIKDISTAGMLCVTTIGNQYEFTQNMLLRDMIITLLTTRVKCNAVIFRTFEKDGEFYIVLLFTKGLPFSTKTAIQAFIQNTLQMAIDVECLYLEKDSTDYSTRKTEATKDDAFLISLEEEEAKAAQTIYANDIDEHGNVIQYEDDNYDEDIQLINDLQ